MYLTGNEGCKSRNERIRAGEVRVLILIIIKKDNSSVAGGKAIAETMQ